MDGLKERVGRWMSARERESVWIRSKGRGWRDEWKLSIEGGCVDGKKESGSSTSLSLSLSLTCSFTPFLLHFSTFSTLSFILPLIHPPSSSVPSFIHFHIPLPYPSNVVHLLSTPLLSLIHPPLSLSTLTPFSRTISSHIYTSTHPPLSVPPLIRSSLPAVL